jgi:hypothetical protein
MEPQLRYFATVARTGNFLIRRRISVRRRSRTSLLAASEISASNSSGGIGRLSFWPGETWYSCEFFDFTADRYFFEGGGFLKFSHPSQTF